MKEDIAGLLIDEIDVMKIFRTAKGLIAEVSAGGKMHLLRQGDQLLDGDVVVIQKDEVVFKQVIQDPAAPKPFREVVKRVRGQ